MKMLRFTAGALLAAALLAGCDQPPPATTESTDTAVAASDCHVTEDRNWRAWVNKQPGPDRPVNGTLHVTGQVDFPATGYTWTLTRSATDDMAGTTVRLDLNTVAPSANEGEPVSVDVDYAAEAGPQTYTEVSVYCGRAVLTTITEVEVVQ